MARACIRRCCADTETTDKTMAGRKAKAVTARDVTLRCHFRGRYGERVVEWSRSTMPTIFRLSEVRAKPYSTNNSFCFFVFLFGLSTVCLNDPIES